MRGREKNRIITEASNTRTLSLIVLNYLGTIISSLGPFSKVLPQLERESRKLSG